MKYSLVLAAATVFSGASATVSRWGQCGGQNYGGDTQCAAGDFCSTLNPYYAQCLSGAGAATTTTSSKTTTTSSKAAVTTTTTSSVRTTTTTSASPIRTTASVVPTTAVTTTTSSKAGTTASTTTPATTPVTTAKPTTPAGGGGGGVAGAPVTLSGNPFAGRRQYPNPYYSSEVYNIAIPSLIAEGKASLTAAAKAAATVPNYIWFDTISKVPTLSGYLDDIRAKNAAGDNIIGCFVVYDLPDRDCAAKASNGELSIAAGGLARYKTEYIDALAAILKTYPDVPVSLIIEPDSVANMITNMAVAKCSNAKASYEDGITYAFKTLNLPNVAMYADAGHAGWLGWPDNLAKAGPYYAGLYKTAGSPKQLRGLATNVANYNAWSITGTCPSYTSDFYAITKYCDEKGYINALAPLLSQNGFPAHFVTDQGRSGKQPTGQNAWGDWCNIKGTGFGIRPDTVPTDPLLDAFVWIKPGGEGDGTSDSSASRYDSTCGLPAAFTPAPEAGTWFQGYFEQLLVNANPKF